MVDMPGTGVKVGLATAMGLAGVAVAATLVGTGFAYVRGKEAFLDQVAASPSPDGPGSMSALEGRIIHLSGMPRSVPPVRDFDLGIQFPSLTLERHPEVRTWEDVPPTLRGASGDVRLKWSATPLPAPSEERYGNRGSIPLAPFDYNSPRIEVNGVRVSPDFFADAAPSPLSVTKAMLADAKEDARKTFVVEGGGLWKGGAVDEDSPFSTGALRVRYSGVLPEKGLFVGTVRGGTVSKGDEDLGDEPGLFVPRETDVRHYVAAEKDKLRSMFRSAEAAGAALLAASVASLFVGVTRSLREPRPSAPLKFGRQEGNVA